MSIFSCKVKLILLQLAFVIILLCHKIECTRSRRSPGIFDSLGIPEPKDLVNKLKPEAFPDFTNLKDQLGLDALRGRVEQGFAAGKQASNSLQNLIQTMIEKLTSIENAVKPDESNYWAETQACGSILVAQTGRIAYKNQNFYNNLEKCVWTIRANYRSNVKVKLQQDNFDQTSFDYVTVTELNTDGDVNEIHAVKLTREKTTYLFKGPIIIISFISDGSGVGQGFILDFEGLGIIINQEIDYRHFHFKELSGSITRENLTVSTNSNDEQSLQIPKSANKKRQISTVIINPQNENVSELTVKVDTSSINLKPEDCKKSSLAFYDAFTNPTSLAHRCCGTKCSRSEYQNPDGIFLITANYEFNSINDFNIEWKLDTEIPEMNLVDTCGGVQIGRKGNISYKVNEDYKNNERCVWVIRPNGKSRVKIRLNSTGLEQGFDFLTATSISSATSNPESVILKNLNAVYNLSGPVILITFFSDDSTPGRGFDLQWEDVGSILTNEVLAPGILYLGDESGTQALQFGSSTDTPVSEIVIVTPHYLDGSGLNLKLDKLEANLGSSGKNGFTIYGNDDGNYSIAQRYYENLEGGFNPEEFETSDGVFILIFYSNESVIGKAEIDFSWKKGSTPKQISSEGEGQVAEQTEGCGGILKGDKGKIDYKLGSPYAVNEKCTWVIESNGMSKISLKLLEDGFESCCDYLMATPLDQETGKLNVAKSVKINREEKLASFSSSVVFVTFYSDSSMGESGFSLEFSSGGKPVKNLINYHHQHFSEISGSVSFPNGNELTPSKNEILTYVFSPDPINNSLLETNISVFVSDLGIDKNCQKDILTFSQIPATPNSLSEVFSCKIEDNNSCECPSTKPEINNKDFTFIGRGFIAIFKSVDSNENKRYKFNWITTVDKVNPTNETETITDVVNV